MTVTVLIMFQNQVSACHPVHKTIPLSPCIQFCIQVENKPTDRSMGKLFAHQLLGDLFHLAGGHPLQTGFCKAYDVNPSE